MDRKSLIGLILIFVLFYVWAQMQAPSQEEIEAQKRMQDSIAQVESALEGLEEAPFQVQDSLPARTPLAGGEQGLSQDLTDSTRVDSVPAAPAIQEETYTLENDKVTISFSNKGGKITGVNLKEYQAVTAGEKNEDIKSALNLMHDERNTWNYLIPQGPGKSPILTTNLVFKAKQENNGIVFTANLPGGGTFSQEYRITDDYLLDYNIQLDNVTGLDGGSHIDFLWENFLPKLEKNSTYEKVYAAIYYKQDEKDPKYLSTTKASKKAPDLPLKWVSFSNQFFNSTLVSDQTFAKANLMVNPVEEEDSSLVYAATELSFKINNSVSERFGMDLYIGPNDFETLKAMGNDVSDIVPFGWSIFGTINRWIIRPLFTFLSKYVGSKGVVIIILTILVKLALFPLTYKMLKSQTMMAGLKPELKKIKDKFKDDQQGAQMETMKLYREYGVSPLGGCMPMVIQMPIWFALYRFFPASIEFRQAGFLWATDLSSYDVFLSLPFNIPMYGSHVSLFTLLWAVSLLGYTHYNMKINPQMSGEGMAGGMNMKMMRNMQYFMPLMFLFFLNSYAAGLTCYLLFSNLTNIIQTVATKEFVLHDEKIQQKLAKSKEKAKDKPRSKWAERFEEAMKEQQNKAGK